MYDNAEDCSSCCSMKDSGRSFAPSAHGLVLRFSGDCAVKQYGYSFKLVSSVTIQEKLRHH
jgi:hypothetical protein